MKIVRSSAFTLLAIVTLTANATPGGAAVIYPWCANYSGRGMGGAQNCGFVNFNQCLATVRGVGGTCDPNPLYEPYPPSPRYARPMRRQVTLPILNRAPIGNQTCAGGRDIRVFI
jgi:hypothetical protein